MSTLLALVLFFAVLLALSLLVFLPLLKRAKPAAQRVVLASLVLCFALTAALYVSLGALPDIRIGDVYAHLAEKAERGEEIDEAARVELLALVRERAQSTNSADYWYILAQDYRSRGDLDASVDAFARAAEQRPEDVQLLALWGETAFIAAGYQLTEEVRAITDRVMAIDRDNQTILGVLGISAFQVGEYELAIDFWNKALVTLPYASTNAEMLRMSIAKAEQDLAAQRLAQGDAPATEPAAALDDANRTDALNLNVVLSESFQAAPQTTVFVLARVPGTAMPLAVTRIQVSDLPAQITLDDSMAMIPGTQLSALTQIEVVARVSFSGQPVASSGDFEGRLILAENAFSQAHQLLIDTRID